MEEATVLVGDIGIRLQAETPGDAFELFDTYDSFMAEGPLPADQPEVILDVIYNDPDPVGDAVEIFNTGSNWSLLKTDGHYLLPFTSPVLEPQLFKMLEIDESFSRGNIRIADPIRDTHSSFDETRRHCPIQYPLDEVLMVNLLSQGRGVEIHGLGIDCDGTGILFTGTSGAGKSTLAEFWKERGDATILSDDRLIVRRASPRLASCHSLSAGDTEGGYILYGTPWHGDAAINAYGGVPLERLLVLEQAEENRLVRMTRPEAAAALLVRCFPTFWDADGMRFTMEFIAGLCAEVPAYEMRFRPEPAALDTALAGLDGG